MPKLEPELRGGIKPVPAEVQRMIDNPGVYVCGDTSAPGATLVILSRNGKLFSTMIDAELSPYRFHPTFIVAHGPLKA